MNARARDLISRLELARHPEGGYFREVHRSRARVRRSDTTSDRAALTTIYFLLPEGEVSRWHRVASDEVWHFYEGAALELFTTDADFATVARRLVGPLDTGTAPVHVVEAGEWQAARSAGPYTLVGCTVAPGFEFADFEMLEAGSEEIERITARHPLSAAFF